MGLQWSRSLEGELVTSGGTMIWGAPSMWIERTPILLANKLGLFQKAGLPALELMVSGGGPELLQEVHSGRVHIGEIGMFPYAAAVGAGREPAAKLVGTTFIQQLDHYLVGRKPGPAKLEDLRGRKVGVLSTGSCDSYLLRLMVESVGVLPSEVESSPLGPKYGKAQVLADGEVDALFLVEPALSNAEDMGVAQLLMKASSMYPRFQWGALFASDQLRQKSPATLLQLLSVYTHAVKLMHDAVVNDAGCEVCDVLDELALQHFAVSAETFRKALKRDAGTWQLDWRAVDGAGVDACIQLQRELGVFTSHVPTFQDLFNVPE